MKMKDIKVGMRVYWNDPAEEYGEGTSREMIVKDLNGEDEDSVILTDDSGDSYASVYCWEIEKIK